MAITLSGPVVGTYDPAITDSSGGFNLMQQVENAYPPASNAAGVRPFTFAVDFLSAGNEDPTLIANAVLNLTTLGVLFPASSLRNVRLKCWSKRTVATNAGYVERCITVQGGAPATFPLVATADATISTDGRTLIYIPNGGSAGAPEYGFPTIAIDGGTGNLFVAVRNNVAAGTAAGAANTRWRVEAFVEPLIVSPVSP